MKTMIVLAAGAALIAGGASAQSGYEQQQQDYQQKQQQYEDQQAHYQDQKREYHHELREWARGQVLPREYIAERYYVDDWRASHLVDPGPGYRWIRTPDGHYVRVALDTGVIADVVVIPR